jgi:hypothetical protein
MTGARSLAAMLLAFALAAPAADNAVAADFLGRLFFTPEQRNRLEQRRQSNVSEVVAAQNTGADNDEPVASYLNVQGQVVRSNGEHTVFINGVGYTGRDAPKGTRLAPGRRLGEVVIVPSDGAAPVPLKVGQSLDKNSLTIDDALTRAGTITVDSTLRRTAPPPVVRGVIRGGPAH